jgi:hypothetical protein
MVFMTAMLALRTAVAQCPALQAALQVLPNYLSELNYCLTALSLRRLVVTSSYRVILFRQTIISFAVICLLQIQIYFDGFYKKNRGQ